MEANIQQPAPLQGRRLLWLIPLPAKKVKLQKVAPVAADPGDPTFYEKAIEWTHRADKVVNLVLGYLLAIASVLGFMDVLSNGQVLGQVPQLFFVWLAIMGLGVDFQILLVIGRVPDLARQINGSAKWVFIGFNFVFLAFLCYMSAIIGAVFTQHRDIVNSTITGAMNALGINSTYFVYERAALATLLLVLMAVDRSMERWRMQEQRAAQTAPENATQASSAQPLQGWQQSELAEALKQIAEMNRQTLASVQQMNQQTMQVTIEQATRVTVEAMKQSLEALPFNQPLQIAAPTAREHANVATPAPFARDYKPEIELLLLENPVITPDEVVQRVNCSLPTAKKWLAKLTESAS